MDDDHHSRQQLDELAELFLTSVVDQSASDQDQDDADNPLEGPEPIRLAPKIQPTTDAEADDALTERDDNPFTPFSQPKLRLTEDESEQTEQAPAQVADTATADAAAAQTTPAETAEAEPFAQPTTPSAEAQTTATIEPDQPAPQALLEGVLMGNLPGMSGPWLTQYAQLLAQTDGPVAILHVEETSIDLELVEPRAESEPAPAIPVAPVRIPPMRDGLTGLVGLLDALVTSDYSPARTILVRMDDMADTQTLSQLTAIEDWTVLCGSDDASVAGVVSQLQSMVRKEPRLADRNVGLMVMGSDESAAQQTAERVASQLENDLLTRVELIGHLKRMQPVQVRDVGSFPGAVWPQVADWLGTLELPESLPAPEPVTQPKPESSEPKAATTPTPERAADRDAQPASRPEPRPIFKSFPNTPRPKAAPIKPSQQRTADAAEPIESVAQTTAMNAPKAAVADRATTTEQFRLGIATAASPTRPAPTKRVLTPAPELDLIALLAQGSAALDNPTALEARIPDQPDTQLAVDAAGTVHIMLQHGSADTEAGDLHHAAMQLIEAGRWVQDNLELLALTQRDCTFVDQAPELHLLTDRADLATRLANKLAGQLRLHLLQQVQVGKASGWFCTPLG